MQTPFIIAELSANHNQSLEAALKRVEAIAKTGANAIKVQTYKPIKMSILGLMMDYGKIHIYGSFMKTHKCHGSGIKRFLA